MQHEPDFQGSEDLAARNIPGLLVLLLMALGLAGIMLAQAMLQADLRFVHYMTPCFDYGVFYEASVAIRHGLSPYAAPGYVTPPLPAFVNIPLTYLDFQLVARLIPLSLFAAVVGGLALLARAFDARVFRLASWRPSFVLLVLTSIGVCFSYPFIFLCNRGNIDGFVLLFLCAGVACLRKDSLWPVLFFTLAISFKIYPILIVLPLIAYRRWKLLAALCLALLALAALTPGAWLDFFQRLTSWRGSVFRIDENGSMANSLYYIGIFVGSCSGQAATALGVAFANAAIFVYAALLGMALYCDWKKPKNEAEDIGPENIGIDMLLYIPFMIAVPKISFHYALVCLLATLPALSHRWTRADGVERALLIWISCGVALSQLHAIALEFLTGSVLPHAAPGLGLFIALLGVVALKARRSAPCG